jgi:hypothetical protein
MGQIEQAQVVKFDEWRWKVSYGMPTHGKDYWGKKAEEREEEVASMKSRTKKQRFILERKSTRRSGKSPR